MPSPTRSLTIASLLVCLGCTPDARFPTGPGQEAENLRANQGGVTVMSRNLYIGANVDAVIAALASPDPSDDFPALTTAIAVLQETDFPTRAAALADEVAQQRPHVIGLQEVTDLDIDLTGLGLPIVISLDFLQILQAELAARGLDYVVAAEVTNVQAAPLPGISLVDHDAILVDPSRVTLGSMKVARNFANNIGVVAPGVEIKRGYVAVDAVIDGRGYVLAGTHLESGNAPGLDQLRAAQAIELATVLGSASPTIVLGDFNDIPGSLMHQVMGGAGFTDMWPALAPNERGYTCCHLANLGNENQSFDQRIDYIFARGVGRPGDTPRGQIDRIGENRSDRIAGPFHSIWPSDHAGLVATLAVPPLASE